MLKEGRNDLFIEEVDLADGIILEERFNHSPDYGEGSRHLSNVTDKHTRAKCF